MRPLIVMLSVTLAITAASAAHDVSCRAIINPQDESYVQADSAIVPKLGIANLGDQGEASFWVSLVIIDGFGGHGDTVYVDSVLVDHLHPYPDTLEVELPEWIPEGRCKDYVSETDGPFVNYELYGVVLLEGDENPDNDTAKAQVSCLFDHNVGVIYLTWPEEPDTPPDFYNPGSTITATATIENFGYNSEQMVPVRLEVRDSDSGGALLWNNVQAITFLDWRNNTLDNPFGVDVTFPPYTVVNDHRFSVEARTELLGDRCPEDDYCIVHIWWPPDTDCVAEDKTSVARINIELSGAGCTKVSFTLPQASRVRLDVFDATGRHVQTLAEDTYQAGAHEITWSERDDEDALVSAGVYIVRMEAGEYQQTRRLVLVR